MGAFIDLTGRKYNRWTVIGYDKERSTRDNKYWICQCECGTIKSLWRGNIVNGNSKSCGCWNKEAARNRKNAHHESKTRLYNVWVKMRSRCNDPKDKSYPRYGGRGITVCKEWENYFSFKEWAIKTGYDKDAKFGQCTIDRINVNGNYQPDNCRWISMKEQCYNRRSNRRITYHGETLTATEWEKKLGYRKGTIIKRLHNGWSEERAVSTIPITR